jgi:single-strand DNA-binding protein
MARSLNSVQIIGNLTRDPELRYTPTGTAVATIGVATNRSWTTDTGEKKEETEFHRVVVWNKLAELCAQLLSKGAKVYFHGRLATRAWTGQDGTQKSTTEIVADDMIVLSGKKTVTVEPEEVADQPIKEEEPSVAKVAEVKSEVEEKTSPKAVKEQVEDGDVSPDDIPF